MSRSFRSCSCKVDSRCCGTYGVLEKVTTKITDDIDLKLNFAEGSTPNITIVLNQGAPQTPSNLEIAEHSHISDSIWLQADHGSVVNVHSRLGDLHPSLGQVTPKVQRDSLHLVEDFGKEDHPMLHYLIRSVGGMDDELVNMAREKARSHARENKGFLRYCAQQLTTWATHINENLPGINNTIRLVVQLIKVLR